MGHHALAIVLALGAAAAFGGSNVTQMDAVGRHSVGSGAGLLVRVARDPLWLFGLVTSILGFVLEAVALSMAPVVLVQPLIVAELPFALPIAAAVGGRRLCRSDWTGIALVSVGLAGVVAVIRPTDAPIVATGGVWALLFGASALFAATLVFVGMRSGTIGRTTAFGAAAGSTFGLLSVVTKATAAQFEHHGLAALAHWQPWALAAVGLVGMTLAQNAYRAGPLAVSLPLLDLGEPVCGCLIALTAFHEHLGAFGGLSVTTFAVAVVLLLAGVGVLDRSPMVRAEQTPELGENLPPGGSSGLRDGSPVT